jgi:hypothetical protein
LSLCVFAVGCGDDLSMKDSNRMYEAFGAVAYACVPNHRPGPVELRRARIAMDTMVAQYFATPDKIAQTGDGAYDAQSMRDTVRLMARADAREPTACAALHREAAAALRKGP